MRHLKLKLGVTLFKQVTFLLTVSAVVLGSVGCSPSSFFGNGEDTDITHKKSYRPINKACAGVSLASSYLDVPEFRKLLDCFNSYGALEPIVQLNNQLTDTELKPIVNTINRYVLNNKSMLYEFERTWIHLQDAGLLVPVLEQLGSVLEKKELISASLALLRKPYHEDRALILKSLEILAKEINRENVSDLLDGALLLARAPVFASLQKAFRAESAHGYDAQLISNALVGYIQDPASCHPDQPDQPCYPGRKLIQAVANGKFFSLVDDPSLLGGTTSLLQENTPKMASVFHGLVQLKDPKFGTEVFDSMTSLFHTAHRPIACMKGSKVIDDGAYHLIREISRVAPESYSDFLQRTNPMQLTAVNPFCTLPEKMDFYYSALIANANSTVLENSVNALIKVYQYGLADLAIDFVGGTGPEDKTGIKLLKPVIQELSLRQGAIEDLILMLALPKDEQRARVQTSAAFLIKPRAELSGQSLYDVLTRAIANNDPKKLASVLQSLKPLVDQDQAFLEPVFSALRRAVFINDANPIINVTSEILGSAQANEELFTVLFKISEMPEFQKSLELLADMSQPRDGRMRELLDAAVNLFHEFALKGKSREINLTSEPVFALLPRHTLTSSQLKFFPIRVLAPKPAQSVCNQISLNFPMNEYSKDGYQQQLERYLNCLKSDGKEAHFEVAQAIKYLQSQKNSQGKNFFNFQIDVVQKLANLLSSSEVGNLIDRFLNFYQSPEKYFDHLLKGLPFWVTETPTGQKGPLAEPVITLIGQIVKNSESMDALTRLSNYGAEVVTQGLADSKGDRFPRLLGYVDELSHQEIQQLPPPKIQQYNRDELKTWIKNNECLTEDLKVEARADEVISDFENAVNNWELQDHRPRANWTKSEFKAEIEILFQKFGDPAQSNPDKPILEALLNVLGYFTLPKDAKVNSKQHYPREYLERWLRERTTDKRLITYFYPGEKKPRVRYVSSLDMIELVTLSSDFTVWPLPNQAIKFLVDIGNAWGDEDYESWPEPIKKKYGKKGKPKTIRQVYHDIIKTHRKFAKLVGYPKRKKCPQGKFEGQFDEDVGAKPYDYELPDQGSHSGLPIVGKLIPEYVRAGLYNSAQILEVMGENLPGSGHPHEGGFKVIRDMVYELSYSSPKSALGDSRAGWANNLSAGLKILRMGLSRQATKQVIKFREDDETLGLFLNGLIDAAEAKDAEGKIAVVKPLRTLFEKDREHQLVWKALDQVFDLTDHLTVENLSGQDFENMKRLGLYAIAGLHRVESQTSAPGTIAGVSQGLDRVLDVHYDYLAKNADTIKNALTSTSLTEALVKLTQSQNLTGQAVLGEQLKDAARDPQRIVDLVTVLKNTDANELAHRAWDEFLDRKDALNLDPNYTRLELNEAAWEILRAFENPEDRGLPIKLRIYLADLMRSQGTKYSDLREILELIGRDPAFDPSGKPNGFYQVLKSVSDSAKNGDLEDFFKMIDRSLSQTIH